MPDALPVGPAEAAAASQLTSDAAAALARIAALLPRARVLQQMLSAPAGVIPVLQASAGVALLLADMQDVAKEGEGAVRVAMAATMADTGCTGLETDTHIITLKDSPRRASVTDRRALPDDYLLPQEPAPERKPDLPRLRKALLNGPVPGAALTNGGAPVVAFTPKRG